MKSIFLIGFMGSGKTTFGKKLAAKLSLNFVDLDKEVAQVYHAPDVKHLIDQKGFDVFRTAESEMLKKLPLTNQLISTGGGTPCYFDNMDWMKQNGTVIFLQVDEGVLLSRLKTTDMNQRPLLKGLDEERLKNFIHEKLTERLPFYRQAHIIFNPVIGSIDDLVKLL